MGEVSPSGNELYRNAPDGSQLKALTGGLIIVRRMKHESIDLNGLKPEQILHRTSKRSGSKFAPNWDLKHYVNWIETMVLKLGWTVKTGPIEQDTKFNHAVGIYRGRKMYTIRLASDGRYLHAYPVE
jgi:hypothetical protein